MPTKIEWCKESINPVVGCSKCSPGCDNCYAEAMARRLSKMPKTAARYAGLVDERGRWTGKISKLDLSVFDRLPQKPCSVFVGSMTDIFHDAIVYERRDDLRALFYAMAFDYTQHTYLLLTKRPDNMRFFCENVLIHTSPSRCDAILPHEAPNIWFGVTVCNQKEVDEKIPFLLNTRAVHRFLSIEPMLGPIDLTLYFDHNFQCQDCGHREPYSACECPTCGFVDTSGNGYCPTCKTGFPNNAICVCTECGGDTHSPSAGLDCVIVGGETGKGARPMHPDWVRSVRDQCAEAGVPFFFKGWGEWAPAENVDRKAMKISGAKKLINDEWVSVCTPNINAADIVKVGRNKSGRLLDGALHNERPW